jgi:TetR/AcrR family transcriptional regulator
MARPRSGGVPTKQRLLDTAAAEFAARGFDGAKVDRIAARARVNKAMLYYHFPSKAGLYLAILREQFGALGEAAASARVFGMPADRQLCRFIDAIAREAVARPTFPAIWLREIAEGGRHLDATVVCALRRVLSTLAAILEDGRREGRFRPVNPLVVQISIVAPLMFFAASAPFRERLSRLLPAPIATPDLADMIAHVQAATLAELGTQTVSRRETR